MRIYKFIPHNMTLIREACGYSQGGLGKIIGCSQQQISNWECGEQEPKINSIAKVAAELGVSVDDFCDWTESEGGDD